MQGIIPATCLIERVTTMSIKDNYCHRCVSKIQIVQKPITWPASYVPKKCFMNLPMSIFRCNFLSIENSDIGFGLKFCWGWLTSKSKGQARLSYTIATYYNDLGISIID